MFSILSVIKKFNKEKVINEERLKIQNEAVEALRKAHWKGIVIMPTGTGKSYVLIEALKALYKEGMSILYTCDSKRLRDEDFNKELDKWGASAYSDVIQKECYATAYRFKGRHFNILLADEGDYAMTPEYSKLFFNNTFDYIIIVSATMDSDKWKDYAKKICPVVYKKQVKDIEDEKVVNKTEFILVPYSLNKKENEQYLVYNERFSRLLNEVSTKRKKNFNGKQLEWLMIERKHFLSGLDSSIYICRRLLSEFLLMHPGCKTLIFCGLNNQADRVCEYSHHSLSEELGNLEKFSSGEIDRLSVCGKINRGVNLEGVNVIIMESMSRSETFMIQKTGRGKRLGVDDTLYVYIPIPYFRDSKGHLRPTIVKRWVEQAGRNMGIEKAKTHVLK